MVAAKSKQALAAVQSKDKLLAMKVELARLRADNAQLREALAQYIEQWETLDGPQLSVLQYLAAHKDGQAAAIAKVADMNVQIADSSLKVILNLGYIAPAGAAKGGGKSARFVLADKGTGYLRSRGFEAWFEPMPGRRARWYVYMLSCADGTLYTGVATDLTRRVDEHNGLRAKGARYTRARRPVTLVYSETAADRAAACRREYRIKRLSRHQKLDLIDRQRSGA